MTPQKQLLRHDPENGVWGDCFRTAIACLCEIPPECVPHFCDKGAAGSAEFQKWRADNGVEIVALAYVGTIDDLPRIMRIVACNNTGMHYLLTGQSQTGCNHVVICKNDKIVWDPSPDDVGIIGPVVGTDQFIIEFLVGALPVEFMRAVACFRMPA